MYLDEIITLCGFGDFSENPEEEKLIAKTAKAHSVEFYPTYYDHELKGQRRDIEAITQELWGMPRYEWSENALHESRV